MNSFSVIRKPVYYKIVREPALVEGNECGIWERADCKHSSATCAHGNAGELFYLSGPYFSYLYNGENCAILKGR
jgi:hypothetical protein